MASFHRKIGWKSPRKRKKKIIVPSVLTRCVIKNSKKIAKKFKKLRNTIVPSFQTNKGRKTQRKRENKNCCFVLFRSYPTRNRKFQKNSKKIETNHYGIISNQNRLENAEKERI